MSEKALFTCHLEKAQMSNLVGRFIEPGEVVALQVDQVESTVAGAVPQAFGDDLPTNIRKKLTDAGVGPAAALELGAEGLVAIDGVGKATAQQILASAGSEEKRRVAWLKRSTPSEIQHWVKVLRERAAEVGPDGHAETGLLRRAEYLEAWEGVVKDDDSDDAGSDESDDGDGDG